MKTNIEPPVRSKTRLATASLSIGRRGELAPEWDFSLWFALLSPVIGFLFGIFEGFLLYH